MILVYITYKNKEEAEKVVKQLLEKKIIACANIFPIKSFYLWKNEIKEAQEIVSILKTKKENWEKLKKEVKNFHSYEVPCIIKIDAEANSEFEKWVNEEAK